MKEKVLNDHFWIKGNKIGCQKWLKSGKSKMVWMDMTGDFLKVVNDMYLAQLEEEKLTPSQLADKYAEYGGS